MSLRPLTFTMLALVAACSGSSDETPNADAAVTISVDARVAAADARVADAASTLDPAPGVDTPGEYTCAGCPDSDISEFQVNAGDATSREFSGQVTGASGNGTFYLRGPNGQENIGPIPTSTDGSFSFEAPLFCGEQLVKCVWSNGAGRYVLVVKVITENCITADIRVTLSWDAIGDDWELHLIKPGGRIYDAVTDCTWTTCIGQGPDWGVAGDASDNPKKDVDDTGDFGPENIFLARPEAGVYTVLVEHWGSGDPMSDGQVVFNVGGQVTVARIENLAPMRVWTVGTIRWPEKTVTTGTSIFDCSAMWSGGCKAPLP